MGDQEVGIKVPRDRNGEFEPQIVKKHEKRGELFNDQILSMYSKGMSTREIQAHLEEIYGVEVSPALTAASPKPEMEDVRDAEKPPA